MNERPHNALAILSLAASPFLIFVSTTNAVFLSNQEYFPGEIELYFPFLALFVATWALGLLVYKLAGYRILVAYHIAGPLFMFLTYLRKTHTDLAPHWKLLLLLPLGGVAMYLLQRLKLSEVSQIFALVGSCLLVVEVWLLVTADVRRPPAREVAPDLAGWKKLTTNEDLPNVYHLMLDAYQTDLLVELLNPKLASELGGFAFYPNNASAYEQTGLSTAAIFSGRLHDDSISLKDFRTEASISPKSLPLLLAGVGYRTFGFQYWEHIEGIENRVSYGDYSYSLAPQTSLNTRIFSQLWLYSHIPETLLLRVARAGLIESSKRPTLTSQFVISAYEGFRFLTEQEEALPATGRYTYFHLLMPHGPILYDDSCHLRGPLDPRPSLLEQAQCTNRLVVDFLDILKRTRRFESSLIVVHGDHGGPFRSPAATTAVQARSRALLLVKLPGVDDSRPLRTSQSKTTVLDIAPTVLATLGLAPETSHEGLAILESDDDETSRLRYYHSYDYVLRLGENSTQALQRYIVEDDGGLTSDSLILLKNNPPPFR